ncbi:class I SAM-dependent methyltransferase [Rhizobium leguminosarum]|uniref:class I SAM-dependent methyltransferase n=1 Tax=Rhizobium leguminosarum TaxID=384 RepID=UPI001AE273B5|nr:SAM-dependent methyltransferase [Rhizobium leguminosarum]
MSITVRLSLCRKDAAPDMNMTNALDNHLAAYTGDNLYDFDNQILLNWYPPRIAALCEGASSLLELGLGHGYTTSILSKNFERHLVLDGSPAVIANFKAAYPDCPVEVRETYFEVFDTGERFDVIVMGFILEHVDDPVQIMAAYRKFLKPGGRMFVAVPNAEVLNRRLGHLAGLLPDMQALSANDHLLGHQRYYTVDTLKTDIDRAGYDAARLEGIYLKPLTTSQLVALNLSGAIIRSLCEVGINYPELSCGILAEITPR